ncbi:MAG TPA: HD domain-containing protein [Vicinamibacterales bacterium]|nr:HD domain-containing protein [Vicinamibacterales bacterium]
MRNAWSEQVHEALALATAAHHEDVRKGTLVPYVMHPFQVGLILDRHGYGEHVMIAGFLHDVLEDPKYGAPLVQGRLRAVVPRLASAPDGGAGFRAAVEEYIGHAFGRRVLELVRHVTEQKLDDRGEKRPWQDRKLDQLGILQDADTEHCALKAADCLDSLRSLSRDLRAHGRSVMDRFNASPGAQLWYYGRVTDLVSRRLGDTAGLAGELIAALREFGDVLVSTGALADGSHPSPRAEPFVPPVRLDGP